MRIGSVGLASLAAAIWINVSGLALVHFVLGQDYVRTMMAHVPHPIGLATVARHSTVRLGFGTLLVLLYVTARPQFESLSTAAVAAAIFVFAAAYVPLSLALNEFGILVGWRLWVALAWGAAEAVVASIVGGSCVRTDLFVRTCSTFSSRDRCNRYRRTSRRTRQVTLRTV